MEIADVQAGRFWARYLMESLGFFFDLIPCGRYNLIAIFPPKKLLEKVAIAAVKAGRL